MTSRALLPVLGLHRTGRPAAVAVVVAVVMSGCSSAPPGPPDAGTVTLTPAVGRFTSVTVGTAFTATTVRGANPAVRITVPQSVAERVVARTDNDRLEISLSEGAGSVGEQSLLATIVVAEPLRAITARQAAAVDASASGSLGRDVRLEAREAATITASVNATSLTAQAAQAATILVTGQADTAAVGAQQAATLRGFDLQAREVDAVAESGSTIEITAMASLAAKASEGSTIRYRGEPQTSIDKDVSSTVAPG